MVVSLGDHIYVLGAHAKSGTQKLYDALVDSFVLN